uniref:Centrosomal protein kizuna n=1 Tax=Callorhinchus milii TaxID=7868 RepID=A0A4W3KFG0_CALMI
MASAARSDCRYLEKVGRLQRELHQSERKRLELERKLLASNKTEQPISKLKGAKLQNYLKEIHEREKIAHLRNQNFLKEFECIEAHAATLTQRTDTLKQMKMEYTKQIKRLLSMWNKEIKLNSKAEEANIKQATNSSGQIRMERNLSKGLYHTATSFMGQQMLEISSSSRLNPQQKYHQPTESLSFSQPHSNKQATSVTAVHTNSMIDNLKLPMSSNGRQGKHCVSDIKDWKTGLQTSEEMPLTRLISSGSESHQRERTGSNRSIRAHSSTGSQELPIPVAQLKPITEKLIQDTFQDVFKNRLTDEEHSHKNVTVWKTATTLKQYEKLPLDSSKSSMFSGRFTTSTEEDDAKQTVIFQTQKNDAEKVVRPSLDVLRLSAEFSASDSDLNNSTSSNEELQEMESFEDVCVLNAHPKPATVGDPEEANRSTFSKHESCPDENKEYIMSSKKEPPSDQNIFRTSKDNNLYEELQVSSTRSVRNEGCLSLEGFFHLLHTVENAVEKTKVTYLELYQTTTLSSEKFNEITR